ncbi:MAG: MFS transporter [bacterium]|nr:MFS transporter [bacterium]
MSQPPASRRALLAWALYDWAASSHATVVETFVFAAYFTRSVATDETVGTAQWGNTIGVAGLVVALAGPILGAITDRGGRRKPWIAACTGLSVAATAALWLVRPDPAWAPFGLLMVALATIGAELAFVPYNAMLPDLAPAARLGRWSGWAWGLGYAGGVACLLVALWLVQGGAVTLGLPGDAAGPVRATFLLTAVWFGVFALPLFLWTPDLAAPRMRMAAAVREGLGQLGASLRRLRGRRVVLRFLVARMIYIDGLATVFALGGVYAAGTFDMSEKEVLLFGIALNATSGIGAAAFAFLDDRLGPRTVIVASLVGLVLCLLAALLARTPPGFWAAGMALGLFVGPVQASSRSLLARLAPPELRAELFGLYALSGKVTAFLGPILVGWLTLAAGSQRVGFAVVLAFFVVGLALMRRVPADAAAPPG